jgi:hypothetical protein
MMSADSLEDPNVRSPSYFIVRTNAPCAACKRSTALFGIALPGGHDTWEGEGEWQCAATHALLFYLEHLPKRVRNRLHEQSVHYRRDHNEAGYWYWMNHCQHCDAQQDDYDLFCEPDGAFMPIDGGESGLELSPVDEQFQASAAGYSQASELRSWPFTF